jgi:LmbE family N-acetylglucosaminyl deacetylase
MSADYFDALGLVRTEELLARTLPTAPGSSGREWRLTVLKTKEECLENGARSNLADVVRVVRITRPIIITSVFVGGRTDGHGNHQVAGQMAQEAFQAAADPAMFPEQIKEGLKPWKTLKAYAAVPFAPITDKGIYDYADGKYYPAEFQNYTDGTTIRVRFLRRCKFPKVSIARCSG